MRFRFLKTAIRIFFLIPILYGCSKEINISSLNSESVYWGDLPEKVKSAFILQGNHAYDVNKGIEILVTNTSFYPVKKGVVKVKYQGQSFYIESHGNKHTLPWIIDGNILYILYDEEGGGPMFRGMKTLSRYPYKKIYLFE
jgi:hypothetical protein